MNTEKLTAKRVAELVVQVSGLPFDANRVRTLLVPHRERVLGAIANNDSRTLTAIAALGAARALAESAYAGEFNGSQLTEHVHKHGWALIDAVLAGEQGAHEALWAAQSGTPKQDKDIPAGHPALKPRGAGPSVGVITRGPAASLNTAIPPRRHDSSNVVTIWGQGGPPRVGAPDGCPQSTVAKNANVLATVDASKAVGEELVTQAVTASADTAPAAKEQSTYAKQARAWGKRAALNIEASTTRAGEPTVVLEVARALEGGEGGYDWARKIVVQLTPGELQLATSLFLGQINFPVEARNHGREHNKWFSLERQQERFAGTYKVALGDGRDTLIVQIGADAKLGSVVALLAKQCAAQMEVEVSDLAMLLRPVAAAYNAAHNAANHRNEVKRPG